MKKFNVTFTENKKYNANTRTLEVQTDSAENASRLILEQFDSFKFVKGVSVPTGKHINIDKVKEVKEDK